MFKKQKTLIIFLLVFIFTLAFSLDPKLLEHWQKTMKYGISSQRSAVIKAIEDNKTTEAYFLINEALVNDPNPDIRGTAAYSLVALKINDEKTWLGALENETNSDTLRKIVYGISELNIKTAGPKLQMILNNRIKEPKESQLNSVVIRAIGTVGFKPSADYILGILTNIEYNTEVRGAAAIAIGDIGDKSIIPVLKALVQNTGEVKDVRMYSAYAIGKTGDPSAISFLSPYIENESEDLNIRLWCIAGFAYIKNSEAAEKLIAFTKVDNVRIRTEAVKALGKMKESSSEEILKYKALYDPDFTVKREARKALQDMGVDVDQLIKDATAKASSATAQAKTEIPGQTNKNPVMQKENPATNKNTMPLETIQEKSPATNEITNKAPKVLSATNQTLKTASVQTNKSPVLPKEKSATNQTKTQPKPVQKKAPAAVKSTTKAAKPAPKKSTVKEKPKNISK
jgi:HEAT repeat protein